MFDLAQACVPMKKKNREGNDLGFALVIPGLLDEKLP